MGLPTAVVPTTVSANELSTSIKRSNAQDDASLAPSIDLLAVTPALRCGPSAAEGLFMQRLQFLICGLVFVLPLTVHAQAWGETQVYGIANFGSAGECSTGTTHSRHTTTAAVFAEPFAWLAWRYAPIAMPSGEVRLELRGVARTVSSAGTGMGNEPYEVDVDVSAVP